MNLDKTLLRGDRRFLVHNILGWARRIWQNNSKKERRKYTSIWYRYWEDLHTDIGIMCAFAYSINQHSAATLLTILKLHCLNQNELRKHKTWRLFSSHVLGCHGYKSFSSDPLPKDFFIDNLNVSNMICRYRDINSLLAWMNWYKFLTKTTNNEQ